MRRLALLAAVVALAVPAVAAGFTNMEPDAAKQWYLDEDQAWRRSSCLSRLSTAGVGTSAVPAADAPEPQPN